MKGIKTRIYTLIILIFSFFFLYSCGEIKEKRKANAVVEEFYKHLNNRDEEKLKEITNNDFHKYLDIILASGKDLAIINKIYIINTEIEQEKANVDIKTIYIDGNANYIQWQLMKKEDKWIIENFKTNTNDKEDSIHN
ncbi:MAG: hypothetical protein LBM25_05005 [Bacteroidales bacterium]|nr:hypothetical protein [Bacteroidales bacterium]